MKQSISPAVAAVIVVVVVALAVFFGSRMLHPPTANNENITQQDYQAKMAQMQAKQQGNMGEASKRTTGGYGGSMHP